MSLKWTALTPLRWGDKGKTRLGNILTEPVRTALAHDMAQHVVDVLGRCNRVDTIALLSPMRPDWWEGQCVHDLGRGLNPELTAWSDTVSGPICVIHADLPLVDVTDIEALLDRAEQIGSAVATDRAGTGSNAIALARGPRVAFQFGPGSRKRHEGLLPVGAVMSRPGLATDVDQPSDLKFLPSRFLPKSTNRPQLTALENSEP